MAVLKRAGPALVLLAGLFGCGDALVDDAYFGEPLLVLEGELVSLGGSVRPDATLRTSLFWSPAGAQIDSGAEFLEQQDASVELRFPSAVTINIFHPPREEMMVAGRGYGVAMVLVYDDVNDNGLFDGGEPFVGDTAALALLYAERPLSAEETPALNDVGSGYNRLLRPLHCEPPPIGPPTSEDCGVPLGAACELDSDCGLGVCIKQTKFDWPGGSCGVPIMFPSGCVPATGRPYPAPEQPVPGYFVRACQQNSDCRQNEGYRCDAGQGACMPDVRLRLSINGEPPRLGFCTQPEMWRPPPR